jgi:hypothetical protein
LMILRLGAMPTLARHSLFGEETSGRKYAIRNRWVESEIPSLRKPYSET